MNDEFDFIEAIRRQAKSNAHIVVGIGDDAAVLRGGAGDMLVATDMLMEGVHFVVEEVTPELIGRKALAVNLSDIAAMAGKPTAAFVSVALPRRLGREFAARCIAGLQAHADEHRVALAGGDTNIWDGPCVINVVVVGAAQPAGSTLRSGARAGDVILVSGALGGSLQGRHLSFQPRLDLAAQLADVVDIHAMIDISDGLVSDLGHILDESRVGAELELAAIPIHADVDPSLPGDERLQRALHDGEDFELLFCVSEADAGKLAADGPFEVPVTCVGRIIQESGCWSVDTQGVRHPVQKRGWEHRW